MTNAYKNYGNKKTPQSQPIPGQEDAMAKNDAGGYAYTIDKWSMLDRFLILGSEGGTYYTKPQEMTVRNANNVLACIAENGLRTVDRIYEISVEGRAVKNTPALFALALAQWKGDEKTRQLAYNTLPGVARTGYHLLMWADFSDNMRGTGSGWQRAVSRWFNDKAPDKLAYQMIKYQQREGWAMSDLLRLSHVKPVDDAHDKIYKWVVDGWVNEFGDPQKKDNSIPDLIMAHEIAKTAPNSATIVNLINQYRLPRESIPTEFLNDVDVWEALLNTGMPLTAMIRNLGKMTSVKLLSPFTPAVDTVVENLTNEDYLRKSRVHPLAILVAQKVYASGKGMKGSLEWKPVPQIIDALDAAFYASFGNVTPTNKKVMLALDVSGSMGFGDIAGMPLTPREASAAMALVTANVEPNYMVTAFSDGKLGGGWTDDGICELPISPKQRLADVIKTVNNLAFGGTDCALPMLYAIEEGYAIDTFAVFTDNETWAGKIHPSQALKKHQRKFDMQSKLAVVGMTSTNFSIADPDSPDMLDVVGFNTATPQIISDFSLNKI